MGELSRYIFPSCVQLSELATSSFSVPFVTERLVAGLLGGDICEHVR